MFPNGICPKVNVIERLEFELGYWDSEVKRFSHHTTRSPQVQNDTIIISKKKKKKEREYVIE